MKTFKWRLDRLLDIKKKDEQLKRTQAGRIAEEIVKAQSVLLAKQKSLNALINKINGQNPMDRFQNQALFINSSRANDIAIQNIGNTIFNLKQQHEQKTKEIIEVKSYIKMLGKLRQKAYEKFVLEQNKIEQNDMDENFSIRLSRTMIEQTINSGR